MKSIKTKLSQLERVTYDRVIIDGYKDEYIEVGELYDKVEEIKNLKGLNGIE